MTELGDYKRLVEAPMIRNHQATVAEFRSALEAKDAEIARLESALRTVQNAAKTIASAHNTELEHLRQNAAFDHKIRSEHESLQARDSEMTDALLAAESRITSLERQLAEETERCARVESLLIRINALGKTPAWKRMPDGGLFASTPLAGDIAAALEQSKERKNG